MRIFDKAPSMAVRTVFARCESIQAMKASDKYRVAVTLPHRNVGVEISMIQGDNARINKRAVLILIRQALAIHPIDLSGLLNQRQSLAGFCVDVSSFQRSVLLVVPHDEVVFLIEKGEVGGVIGRLVGLMKNVSGVQQAADYDAALVVGQIVRRLMSTFMVAFLGDVAEGSTGQFEEFKAFQWIDQATGLHVFGHACQKPVGDCGVRPLPPVIEPFVPFGQGF